MRACALAIGSIVACQTAKAFHMLDKIKNIIKNKVGLLRKREPAVSAVRKLRKFLKSNGCLYHKRRDDDRKCDVYYFDYQGGHFVAVAHDHVSGVEIDYPGILAVDKARLELVRTACNRANAASAQFKFVYMSNDDGNQLNLHMQCYITAVADDDPFESMFADFFVLQRDFVEMFNQMAAKADEEDKEDVEKDLMDEERLQALTREQELRHLEADDAADRLSAQRQALRLSAFDQATVTVGKIIDALEQQGNLIYSRLTVTTPMASTVVTAASAIHNFNVVSPLSVQPRPQWVHLFVEYTAGHDDAPMIVEITLVPVAERNKVLYAMMNVVMTPGKNFAARPPMCHNGNDGATAGDVFSSLIVIDPDPEAMRAEFDYVMSEIERKEKSGEELTSEENQLYVFSRDERIAASLMYFGRNMILEERWIEALSVLTAACELVRTGYYNGDDNYRRHYAEACYLTALAANKLKLYDVAMKYIAPFGHDGRISHAQEWVTALCGSRDLRIFDELDRFRNEINEQFGDDDDPPQGVINLVNFLRRRRAWALVEFGDYDEAKRLLRTLRREEANRDFALAELAHIKRLEKTPAETT